MYEEYTDKQIVEMLKPKLEKLGWSNGVVDFDLYPDFCKMIARIYCSAYIRGQLGRSFIIGEKKAGVKPKTEHWGSATKTNLVNNVKVRYLNADKHKRNPEFYPAPGVVGEVKQVYNDGTCLVQWPGFHTSWYASWDDLEVLVCE